MSFHERAVKADKDARREEKEKLKKKYPYIDLNQFKVLTHIDGEAKAHPEVNGNDIDIPMDKLNDAGLRALMALMPKPPFPKLWSGGSVKILLLPKGKRHGHINQYNHSYWYDGFPGKNILDYPINNFRVYVKEKDYFLSKLPILSITTNRTKANKWYNNEDYYQTSLEHIVDLIVVG